MSLNLPRQPGLARRLAYGEHVRKRRRDFLVQGYQISPITSNRGTSTNNASTFTYEELIELQDVKVGLDMKNINYNSRVYAKGSKLVLNINICIICQEYFKLDYEIIREMNCSHPYHLNCIDKWFEQNTFCPICKHIFN